jgi:hypothetical protein
MSMRPQQDEYHSYYERYVSLVDDSDIVHLLEKQRDTAVSILEGLTEEQGDYRYAEGKWSLKEVFGHLADAERIMSYRLMRIARGDQTPLPGFTQNDYVAGASFERWSVAQMLEEYSAVRRATLSLVRGLADEAWSRTGVVSDNPISVRALAYIVAGHELHHLRVIKERYLP